ncbi:MAG: AAA family ATPase [Pseudomonadota bacterium]
MKVLITGMSGTGKSTIVVELAGAGYVALDLDEDGFSKWMPCDGNPTGANPGYDWVWNEERLDDRLRQNSDIPVFLAGCAPNMGRYVQQFDRVVLLTAPVEVLLNRVRSRSGNDYGKTTEEADRIVANKNEVEPLLRRIATHEVDASKPLADVVNAIVDATV